MPPGALKLLIFGNLVDHRLNNQKLGKNLTTFEMLCKFNAGAPRFLMKKALYKIDIAE